MGFYIVNIVNYECPNASINIFLYNINYSFITKSKINILIADYEYLGDFNIDLLKIDDENIGSKINEFYEFQ